MRISDWSSDVCSSDLQYMAAGQILGILGRQDQRLMGGDLCQTVVTGGERAESRRVQITNGRHVAGRIGPQAYVFLRDRKSVGEGKRVSVSVDFGGRGFIKKKHRN